MKSRNHIARALKSPHLAPKRVAPRKGKGSYRRKAKFPASQHSVKVKHWRPAC